MNLLFTNAEVHTLDDRDSIFNSVAIDGDRIIAVGDDIRPHYTDYHEIDLDGVDIYPGFVDAHAHIFGMGERLTKPRLEGLDSKEEIYETLKRASYNDWIVSRGWDQTRWPGGEFPTKEDLDRNVSRTQPIALTRIDGHALWCNSKALEIARIDSNASDPLDGAIVHDPSGEPTGILLDEAMKLVESKIPQPTKADLVRSLRVGLDHFAKMGHVAVHEMGVSREMWEAYETLYERDGSEVPHAYVFLDMTKESGRELFLEWCDNPSLLPQPKNGLHFVGIKLYLDGALGSRGANLFEDYSDDPGNRGLALMEDEDALHLMQLASDNGLQIAVHAIGDKANARALDLFSRIAINQYVLPTNSIPPREVVRRIEHAQIVRDVDVTRFRNLDVYALIQPAFYRSDRRWAAERLGAERMRTAYRWKSFLDAGVKFVASSDAPIESPDPLDAIELLTTRDGVNDGEVISREQAIRAYSQTAHELTQDRGTGKIGPGMRADLTIAKGKNVIATIVNGRAIYSDHPLL